MFQYYYRFNMYYIYHLYSRKRCLGTIILNVLEISKIKLTELNNYTLLRKKGVGMFVVNYLV